MHFKIFLNVAKKEKKIRFTCHACFYISQSSIFHKFSANEIPNDPNDKRSGDRKSNWQRRLQTRVQKSPEKRREPASKISRLERQFPDATPRQPPKIQTKFLPKANRPEGAFPRETNVPRATRLRRENRSIGNRSE